MTIISSLTSSLLTSKTYLIEANHKCVIIIDPGDPDISELLHRLCLTSRKSIKVLLTHEHADHCAGLSALYAVKKFELFCTLKVAENLSDNKRNLSKYLPNIGAFEVNLPVTIIADSDKLNICNLDFTFIETPGHSPGSICIFFNNSVFTGDTILNNTKTPLNLPFSDKNQYLHSMRKLEKIIQPGMTIYPGHGEPFIWNSVFP